MSYKWIEADRHWQLQVNSTESEFQGIIEVLNEKNEENILINLLNLKEEELRNFISDFKNFEHNPNRFLIVAGTLDDDSGLDWAPTLSEATDLMFMSILEKELSEE